MRLTKNNCEGSATRVLENVRIGPSNEEDGTHSQQDLPLSGEDKAELEGLGYTPLDSPRNVCVRVSIYLMIKRSGRLDYIRVHLKHLFIVAKISDQFRINCMYLQPRDVSKLATQVVEHVRALPPLTRRSW